MNQELPNPYGVSAPLPSPSNTPSEPLPEIDESKIHAAIAKLQAQQNFPLAAIAGFAATILCAAIWAGITVLTMFQIGYMAVGVGLFVGYVVRVTGKGLSSVYGIMGAACALVGCFFGNYFSTVAFIAKDQAQPFWAVALAACTNLDLAGAIVVNSFAPMDLLFYGIAVYEAYHCSFRELTEADALAALDEA